MDSAKTLGALARRVDGRLLDPSAASLVITDVTHDSTKVEPGWMFVAISGQNRDGHVFVPAAIDKGAVAVCVENPTGAVVPELVVASTRSSLAGLAAAIQGDPSKSLDVIGVTGTNGKTTVTHYVESIVTGAGRSAGLIGTIRTLIAGTEIQSVHTTPESSDFQRLLARMLSSGVEVVAAEISSHALDLHRADETRFEVAAFTNLSQDHLDFHGSMEAYEISKTRLFRDFEVATSVINIDDPAGHRIASVAGGSVLTVGEGGDIRYRVLGREADGVAVSVASPWGEFEARVNVFGLFNVFNAVLAATCCLLVGVEVADVQRGLGTLSTVPGRFEVVSEGTPFTVIVDYAHTPAGVEESIATARSMTEGRVIALVGAGGDRDADKRALMGKALSGADLAIVTTDNPRSEDPAAIAASVAEGLDPTRDSLVQVDRREAIESAVRSASEGDVVLILGRGHEPIQDRGDVKVPFDDREVARATLNALRMSADSNSSSGSMSL